LAGRIIKERGKGYKKALSLLSSRNRWQELRKEGEEGGKGREKEGGYQVFARKSPLKR